MGDSRPSPAVPKFHRRATVIALRSSCGPESDNPCAEFETIGLRKKQQTLRTRPLHHAGGTLYSPPRGQLCSKLFYAYPDLEHEQQNCIMENSDSKIYSDRKLKIFETLPLLRI